MEAAHLSADAAANPLFDQYRCRREFQSIGLKVDVHTLTVRRSGQAQLSTVQPRGSACLS